jgi:hypothetical protein
MSARRPPTAAGATYGARRTRHFVAVASQPEMDTQVGDMEGPQVAGSVRTAVLDNLWLADLTQMQATSAMPRGQTRVPKCLLIQGRCPAEYLALLPSHTARVITSARSGKLCAMDLQSDQKMGSISAHMHSCMHCGRAQSDTMVAAVHRCCSVPPWRRTLPSSRIRILVRVWTGMRPGCPGAVHSVTGVGR